MANYKVDELLENGWLSYLDKIPLTLEYKKKIMGKTFIHEIKIYTEQELDMFMQGVQVGMENGRKNTRSNSKKI